MTNAISYGMTDEAIARELGDRLEQVRLRKNITQEQVAEEIGVSRTTYRKLAEGQAKLVTLISALRYLGELEALDGFLPAQEFSPMAAFKAKGKQRQRARTSSPATKEDDSEW